MTRPQEKPQIYEVPGEKTTGSRRILSASGNSKNPKNTIIHLRIYITYIFFRTGVLARNEVMKIQVESIEETLEDLKKALRGMDVPFLEPKPDDS